jgi:hypothetical protein
MMLTHGTGGIQKNLSAWAKARLERSVTFNATAGSADNSLMDKLVRG